MNNLLPSSLLDRAPGPQPRERQRAQGSVGHAGNSLSASAPLVGGDCQGVASHTDPNIDSCQHYLALFNLISCPFRFVCGVSTKLADPVVEAIFVWVSFSDNPIYGGLLLLPLLWAPFFFYLILFSSRLLPTFRGSSFDCYPCVRTRRKRTRRGKVVSLGDALCFGKISFGSKWT